MDVAERLAEKAREYEVLAASHSERAPLASTREHAEAATAFTVAAVVLREVALVLDEDGRE
jgi:hypothetical protein